MPMQQLSLATLKDLDDGRVAVAFLHELTRIVQDCEDRPGDKKSRKVLLQGEVTPIMFEDGTLDSVKVEFQIKSSVPTRKSKTYTMAVRKGQRGAMLVFSSENPEDHRQKSLIDDSEE